MGRVRGFIGSVGGGQLADDFLVELLAEWLDAMPRIFSSRASIELGPEVLLAMRSESRSSFCVKATS